MTDQDAAVAARFPIIRCERENWVPSNSQFADFADLGFFDFVGAAFARSRGTHVVATQRVSPFRPFKSVILGGTETVLSLHGVWTRKTRDKATIYDFSLNGGFVVSIRPAGSQVVTEIKNDNFMAPMSIFMNF